MAGEYARRRRPNPRHYRSCRRRRNLRPLRRTRSGAHRRRSGARLALRCKGGGPRAQRRLIRTLTRATCIRKSCLRQDHPSTSATRTVAFRQRFLPQPQPPCHLLAFGQPAPSEVRQAASAPLRARRQFASRTAWPSGPDDS